MIRRCAAVLGLLVALGCEDAPTPPPTPTTDPVACRACDDVHARTSSTCKTAKDGCARSTSVAEALTDCLVEFDECIADAYDTLSSCETGVCDIPRPARWGCVSACWRSTGACEQRAGDALIACARRPGCDPPCYNACVAGANAALRACDEAHNSTCLPACPPM